MGHRTRRRSCVRACRDLAKETSSPRGPVPQAARALDRFPHENFSPEASPPAAPPKPPVCKDPSQAPRARSLDNGKVQTLHGNVPGDFYMGPSVPRRSEMPRFKTWRSDVAAPVREPFEPLGGVPNGGKYVLRRHPDSSKVPLGVECQGG